MEENSNENSFIKSEGIEKQFVTGDPDRQTNEIRTSNGFRTFEVPVRVVYDQAADANYYHVFYTANVRCFFIEARARFSAAGGAGSTVTIEKLKNDIAQGSGTSILGAGVSGESHRFDLGGTANKVQWKIGTDNFAALQLSPGDSLALKTTGTLTNARHLIINCLLGINEKDIPTGKSVSAVIAGL